MKVRGSFRARSFGLLATSTAAHLVIFSSLGLIPSPSEVLAREEMEFEVIEPPKPEEPPPEPEPEPPKDKPKEVTRKAAAPEPEPPPPDAPPPSEAPAEEVEDFTGTTLTAGDGAGWSTAVGSGGALKGPVGKIGGGQQPSTQPGAKTVSAGPRVVPLASLSRKPAPPSGLDDLLQKNYPSRARMQGVEGRVVMEVRLLPSGRVGEMRVVEEFPPAFAFATECRKTLRAAPPFSPGLDRDGNPVATDIKFTCSFVVDD